MSRTVHKKIEISYEEHGSGDEFVFLPGTATDSSVWMPGVVTHMDGFRSIMVDPRDTPKSSEAPAPYTPADLAEEAVAVLDAAAIDAAHVVGYSLGGAAAQELALLAPRRVRSLTLVCTWGRTDAYLRHVFEWLRDGLAEAGMEWALKALLWLVFTARAQADAAMYAGLLQLGIAWGQKPSALSRQLEADIAHDSLGRLHAVSCPVLVVGGEDDVFVPARYSSELADAIPGARLEVMAGAAHSIPIENQPELFGLIRELAAAS
ncbi:MAG: alpha/beta fold hydrolase [Actinomycetota bacterium]